jgi:hypothetical protein
MPTFVGNGAATLRGAVADVQPARPRFRVLSGISRADIALREQIAR